ncbi:MAG: protein phosphatase 2C domain-containing protein [Eubacterium sp.]|nr:protein phosphatase 2C domain-containing protein [Eubacterium sp.]
MRFVIDAACGSTIGKVRSNNEDNFLFDGNVLPQVNNGQLPPLEIKGQFDGDLCVAVFDGMGGGDLGEVASYTAASQMLALLSSKSETDIEAFMRESAEILNQSVYDESVGKNLYQMGTTEAAMYFSDDSVIVCNVGDSSVYGLRGDKLLKISLDHTDEEYMKQQGVTGRKPRLTQYLGMDPMSVRIEPHVVTGSLNEGDVYIICSDGLTDMVTEERIKEIVVSSESASGCVTELINEAMNNGGRDNTTVIVSRILERLDDPLEEIPEEFQEQDQQSFGNKLLSRWKKFVTGHEE